MDVHRQCDRNKQNSLQSLANITEYEETKVTTDLSENSLLWKPAFSFWFPGLLFAIAVIGLQVLPWWGGAVFGLLYGLIGLGWKRYREFLGTVLLYIVGFTLYTLLRSWMMELPLDREWGVILSRFGLLGLLLPFVWDAVIRRSKPSYLRLGSFRQTIYFPFIWKGFIADPIWRFLLISLSIITITFLPFIDFHREQLFLLLSFGVLFGIVNGILEELVWRGFVLSRMAAALGQLHGLLVTSLAFGLYHYSLGISWPICILFAGFGVMMGGLTLRSGGIGPVTVMHIMMNIFFVLSGMIF
ncbi:CPBP family intramembrane glutamic endopeptidase [Paenibacillus turpanensis]|uniref:CPBP family intramembrane glutamic endopeptidase n=1 Tax=Paenibacillus turpanensis TaxID=2689078 RepID=UPI00140E1A3D|nr:type II CAAX endopeptidase family protein [Paenibacillus turpanensis]